MCFLENKSQVTSCSCFYVKSIYCVFLADVQCRPGASFHHPAQCFTRARQSSHPGGPAAPSPDWSRGKQRKRIFSVSGVDHSRQHGSTRWFRTDGPLRIDHQVRSCACAFFSPCLVWYVAVGSSLINLIMIIRWEWLIDSVCLYQY